MISNLAASFDLSQISCFDHVVHPISAQSSELAQPSYFSNPALMDDNNLPSLNVDTNSLPTPTRGRGVENHPLLRLSPPPLLPHINAHALIHTLHTSYLPLPLPPPHDQPYFCALMNSLSIQKKIQPTNSAQPRFPKCCGCYALPLDASKMLHVLSIQIWQSQEYSVYCLTLTFHADRKIMSKV